MLMSFRSRVFGFLESVLPSQLRMAASPRLLGRYSGGAGAAQEIQLGAGFSMVGDTLTYTSGAGAAWGAITGTLASQADLAAALNAKAASTHSHVSADITDATSSATSNTIVKRNVFGGASFNGLVAENASFTFATFLNSLIFSRGAGGDLSIDTPTASRAWSIPDTSGKVCILRPYADSTAANAAVSVGDAWWDTTLNKARVRLT